jgi:hypothetical protein
MREFKYWIDFITHLRRTVPDQRIRLVGHVFPTQFHWKTYWTHRLRCWPFCLKAFAHQVKFHVQGNTIPNKRCQVERQLGQCARIWFHAAEKMKMKYTRVPVWNWKNRKVWLTIVVWLAVSIDWTLRLWCYWKRGIHWIHDVTHTYYWIGDNVSAFRLICSCSLLLTLALYSIQITFGATAAAQGR